MKHRPVLATLKSLQSGALNTRPGVFVLSALFTGSLVLMTSQSLALTKLSDDAMSGVSGAGLAFAFDDFRFQMDPTSYFGNIGSVPTGAPGTTNAYKGDYLWIGTSITRGYPGGATLDYGKLFNFSDYIDGSGKFISTPTATNSSGISYTDMWSKNQTLSYPIAQGGAQGYAEINNPFVMRVRSYNAVGLNTAHTDWVGGIDHTVLELVGPTHSTPFRWAFWGQVNAYDDDGSGNVTGPLVPATGLPAGVTSAPFSTLENQEIIIGSPTSRFKPDGSRPAGDGTGIEIGCSGGGSTGTGCNQAKYEIMGPVFRMYQSMGEGNNDRTLGMLYHHRLSGDYRFSVNEPGSKTAGSARIPTFDTEEGMYFTHVNAYLPMGQLHYQSLIVTGVQDGTGKYTGDFITETSQVPNDPNAYNDFYGYPGNGASTTAPSAAQLGYNRIGLNDRYYETHGYVRWGNNFPTNAEFSTALGSGSAGSISNGMPGTGVTGIAGYSTTTGNHGIITGNNINVTYKLDPMAVNATNILNVYNAGTLGLGSADIGLCQGGRDKHCGHDDSTNPASDMYGTMQQYSNTVSIGVTTPGSNGVAGSPAGEVSTKGALLSAGGMVFLAKNGGSWTLPQNPNLATSTAGAMTNLLIANDWEVKEGRTTTSSYTYDCGTLNPCNTGWKLTNATTPDAGKINGRATSIINANGGASATLRINGINLGSSRVEGMLIQHLKVTTLGAAN